MFSLKHPFSYHNTNEKKYDENCENWNIFVKNQLPPPSLPNILGLLDHFWDEELDNDKTFASKTWWHGFKNRRNMNIVWAWGKRRTRVHGKEGGMNLIIECRCNLSKVKTLASSQIGTVSSARWNSECTGRLFCSPQLLGIATDRVGTGTQQHGNYWINSMKVIVSVVNSITAFWFCFIWPNYGLPYVCKCDLHLHSSSLLFTLWTPMTKFSPVNLTQDQKATSRPCIGQLYVTGSISFQESTF